MIEPLYALVLAICPVHAKYCAPRLVTVAERSLTDCQTGQADAIARWNREHEGTGEQAESPVCKMLPGVPT